MIQFFIRRRVFINLLTLLVLGVGGILFLRANRETFPEVSMGMVMVQIPAPGMSAEDVENLITIRVEEELRSVVRIQSIRSVSVESFVNIQLRIDENVPERDHPDVVNDIQRAVDRVKGLPEGTEDIMIMDINTQGRPILSVVLSGGEPGLLRDTAIRVADRLREVKVNGELSVADVDDDNLRNWEIWVEVDPVLLARNRISIQEVSEALARRNLNIPGGNLDVGSKEVLIRTLGEYSSNQEIMDTVIRGNDLGRVLQVKDVARITKKLEREGIIRKIDGHPAVGLNVKKRLGIDVIAFSRAINNEIAVLAEELLPKGMKIKIINDMSIAVERRLSVLRNNGLGGLLLVLVALMIALKFRIAAITVLGMMVAFCGAVILILAVGITVNLISMFGFVMVLGMLVDDAIVVAENAARHMEMGEEPEEAAVKGTREVIMPVTATVLTTVAAFVPLLVMGGMMGKFMWQVPAVIIAALMVSILEAFFMLPSHIVDVFKKKAGSTKNEAAKIESKPGTGLLSRSQDVYSRMLVALLARRNLVFFGGPFLIVALMWGMGKIGNVKFVLFPSEGIGSFFIGVETPEGSSLRETEAAILPIEKACLALPASELDSVFTTVGMMGQDQFTRSGANMAQIGVVLNQRKVLKKKASVVMNELRQQLKDLPGIEKIDFQLQRGGPPVGRAINVQIRGSNDFEVLTAVAEKIKTFLHTLPGVLDISDNYIRGRQELQVHVDDKKAERHGLDLRTIGYAIRGAMDGLIATTLRQGKEEIDVRVIYDESDRSVRSLEDIKLTNRLGQLVDLRDVARIEAVEGLQVIQRDERHRTIVVSAGVDQVQATSFMVNAKLNKQFKDISKEFPGISLKFEGENQDTLRSMRRLGQASILALGLIFMILASLFGSLVQPLAVVAAIPLSLVGVMFMHVTHGRPFSFLSIMGIIGLTGVVVNNSLILVSFANSLREKGASAVEAMLEAGRTRLRPVFLTTLTTVLGMAPLAYGIGGKEPFLQPMGLTMGWGLLAGSILTLILVPIFYVVLDEISSKIRRLIFGR